MSVREQLPQEFVSSMRTQLGEEIEDFLDCYEKEGWAGIRLNTSKISVQDAKEKLPFLLRSIPWTENGFYVEKKTKISENPFYYAGLYYIQEPSAMLPASRLPVNPGDMVLDLCAAPGGKATELSSRLKGSGLLVANDVSASRANALLKNLTVWGTANICVTAETPQRLLDAFGCYFDKILVDAPCSGEGMFRKEKSLISSWMKKGPKEYAPKQKEILSCAIQMLKPGGFLLYSTCTFSEEEDEAVIADALRRWPEMSLVQQELTEGFSPGRGLEECIRLYPHRVEGEGHFLALLQKHPLSSEKVSAGAALQKEDIGFGKASGVRKDIRIPESVRAFRGRLPKELCENFRYEQIGDQCLLLPPCRLPKGLRYLRTGLLLGTVKRERFEPSQALAMVLDSSGFEPALNLSAEDERVWRYLRGETIALKESEEKKLCSSGRDEGSGWVLVCVDGYGLGWGKLAGGRLKNKYYSGWRVQ